jgi:hypothetical protein
MKHCSIYFKYINNYLTLSMYLIEIWEFNYYIHPIRYKALHHVCMWYKIYLCRFYCCDVMSLECVLYCVELYHWQLHYMPKFSFPKMESKQCVFGQWYRSMNWSCDVTHITNLKIRSLFDKQINILIIYLPPVVCRRARVLFTLYVFVCA